MTLPTDAAARKAVPLWRALHDGPEPEIDASVRKQRGFDPDLIFNEGQDSLFADWKRFREGWRALYT